MTIRRNTAYLSRTMIDTGLWAIQRYLISKFGCDRAELDMEPLRWYIETCRACPELTLDILNAKPFMIGRILHVGGSTDEVIQRVKNYVGWTEN